MASIKHIGSRDKREHYSQKREAESKNKIKRKEDKGVQVNRMKSINYMVVETQLTLILKTMR